MERRARFTLHSLSPPFRRRVSVRRITVGGFLDLVRTLAPRAAEALLRSKQPLTDVGLIRACADAESVSIFADLVAVNQPIGFMHPWLHGGLGGAFARRNTAALLSACREVEGEGQWTRFLGTLNRGGGKPAKQERGGLAADAADLCRMGFGTWQGIMDTPLQDFLNLCDAVKVGAKASGTLDPTLDPDAEPSDSIGIPGLWQVH